MLCIQLENRDPYYCLAAEEYLLKNYSEDIFLLWQCENTVIVGKHQNVMAEINYPFVVKNDIDVARRMSGGGTVFHDSGNLNFSYIKSVENIDEISFDRFTKHIIRLLREYGVEAIFAGHNDLLFNGKKISGNAQHISKNRVLHHGTLLLNSNLGYLKKVLQTSVGKYKGKAVLSNPSHVTNILPFFKKEMTIDEFKKGIMKGHLLTGNDMCYTLLDKEMIEIQKLADEKYKSWQWNYAYSPKYVFENHVSWNGKTVDAFLEVKKGCIVNSKVTGDFFRREEINKLNNMLLGKKHLFTDLKMVFNSIYPRISDDFVLLFF